MKFQILIPQYKESEEVVKPLLDSISIQQNVDFSEVGVVICNDGSDVFLSDSFLNSYPFKVEYYKESHRGVSATRNACLDRAIADYIMFCDADDMFYNACAFYIIFREMSGDGFDTLTSAFIEESRHPETKEIVYINHNIDSTFVHGKVHRRKYLINNNIRWNDSLTIHEDSYFNVLCQTLTKNGKYCQTPFYLWRWRDESVCRHDPLYLNKTMVNMLDSNTALIKQFLDRKMEEPAKMYATSMIYDVYYSLNCDRWWSEEGNPYLLKTEQRFKKYWRSFKTLFDKTDEKEKNSIIVNIKNRFFTEGLMLERITFNDWIKHIEELEVDNDESHN